MYFVAARPQALALNYEISNLINFLEDLDDDVSTTQGNQCNTVFGEGDVFVLFGELFGRGYATGLLEQAKAAGMTVIGITVGRPDENNKPRKLTAEELAEAEANLGGKIINVPLRAGFELDAPEGAATPTDLVNEMSIKDWQEHELDWDHVATCRDLALPASRMLCPKSWNRLTQ